MSTQTIATETTDAPAKKKRKQYYTLKPCQTEGCENLCDPRAALCQTCYKAQRQAAVPSAEQQRLRDNEKRRRRYYKKLGVPVPEVRSYSSRSESLQQTAVSQSKTFCCDCREPCASRAKRCKDCCTIHQREQARAAKGQKSVKAQLLPGSFPYPASVSLSPVNSPAGKRPETLTDLEERICRRMLVREFNFTGAGREFGMEREEMIAAVSVIRYKLGARSIGRLREASAKYFEDREKAAAKAERAERGENTEREMVAHGSAVMQEVAI